ncbi:MAG: hypothetical protein HY318_01450 [Armatimonadetes bacterium]|nr:hypothetical protein [Armatimonadota bacterium]
MKLRCCVALACVSLSAVFTNAWSDLLTYVQRPEPAYKWELREKINHPQGTVYDLHLVSQVWQDITWEHSLQVYQPKDTRPSSTLLLMNTGGNPDANDMTFGMEVAQKMKAPFAVLYNVPKQPLFGGKTEDALIAETFMKYLTTRDESWPLLFPMVKSVVKAMDALQSFSQQEWKKPIKGFVITGASKRGWTSWLTGATGDKRVKAIAPMVIDVLNIREQMRHQQETLGGFSEEIGDFTARGLPQLISSPLANDLLRLVDPYSYRDKLTGPKLLILGNNDPYWSTDALNIYWDGLKGDKWIVYTPNAGHNLQQQLDNGAPQLTRAVNGLAAFARSQRSGKRLPRLRWQHDDADGKLRLTIHAKPAPLAGRLWVARSPSKDFRKAKWVEQPATLKGNTVLGMMDPPTEGFVAFYGELEYETDGLRYYLSTQLRVAGKP